MSEFEDPHAETREAIFIHEGLTFGRKIINRALGAAGVSGAYPSKKAREAMRRSDLGPGGRLAEDVREAITTNGAARLLSETKPGVAITSVTPSGEIPIGLIPRRTEQLRTLLDDVDGRITRVGFDIPTGFHEQENQPESMVVRVIGLDEAQEVVSSWDFLPEELELLSPEIQDVLSEYALRAREMADAMYAGANMNSSLLSELDRF